MNALEKLALTCGNMENWFRDVGRTVLLEAIGDTCDRINNSFKTGIDPSSVSWPSCLLLTNPTCRL